MICDKINKQSSHNNPFNEYIYINRKGKIQMTKNKFLKYAMILTGVLMTVNIVLIYNFYKIIVML